MTDVVAVPSVVEPGEVTAPGAADPAEAPCEARRGPGRQRSEAADQAILTAALDLLAADGYGGLTMAAVIARSGVSSATLYRRWPTKQQLVAAAVASLHAQIVDVDTGSLEGDLAAVVESIAASMSVQRDDVAESVLVELRRNPEFRSAIDEKFLLPRLAVMEAVVGRAHARGELPAAIPARVAQSFVSGPLHHRVFVLHDHADEAFKLTVVQGAAAALRALAAIAPPA
jgi:AcrR family transcriptional regulator